MRLGWHSVTSRHLCIALLLTTAVTLASSCLGNNCFLCVVLYMCILMHMCREWNVSEVISTEQPVRSST